MANYNYSKLLSFLDFEELSRDVVSLKTGIEFEGFAEGKDHGIDFRFSKKNNNNDIIIQAKRYSKYSDLKFILKEELDKVKKLNPTRYILCTSIELSVDQKNEIFNSFKPYIKTTSDIYTKSEFDNILSKNDDLLTKHYKLWLTDIKVLQKIFHTDIYTDIKFELTNIQKTIKTYVYNDSYSMGIESLKKYRFLVISGNPGIGKSTLARIISFNILNKYQNDKYEFIFVRTLNDLKRMYHEGKKQIIVLDDFLGRTINEFNISTNRPSDLLNFVDEIRKSRTHFMILTTREYILQQAKNKYDLLNNPILDLAKTTIKISAYTQKIRSHILFNHLYYSEIDKTYINSILKDNIFLDIIKSRNFNPRIIEHITNIDFLIKDNINSKNYAEYIIDKINNAKDVWEDIFKNNKITQEAKILCYILYFYRQKNKILEWYEEKYNIALECFKKLYSISIVENQFEISLKEVLSTIIILENNKLDFYDPSVEDFLTHYINQNKTIKHNIFDCLNLLKPDYEQQVLNILTFDKKSKNNIIIDKTYYNKVKVNFINHIDNITLSRLYDFINKLPPELDKDLTTIIIAKLEKYNTNDLIKLWPFEFMYYLKLIEKYNVINLSKTKLLEICLQYDKTINYLDNVCYLVDKYGKNTCTELIPSFNSKIIEAVDDVISDIDDIDSCKMVNDSCSELENNLEIDLSEQINNIEYLEFKFEENNYYDADELEDINRKEKQDEEVSDASLITLYSTLLNE